MKRIVTIYLASCAVALVAWTTWASAADNTLHVGWAQVDITPDRPVALIGQMHKRISTGVLDPLTATALALETRGEGGAGEQAIMVSCDVIFTRKAIQERLRTLVKDKIVDFDTEKLFLNATHTHTAPGFIDGTFKGRYDVSKDDGVMKAGEYAEFFLERVAQCVVSAWESRKPGGMSWALGHAVVGTNRRAHYFDGHTDMYGGTNHPDFSNIEGYEDHAVEMLFFWDADKEMTGVVINIACPAQETENLNEISADFWHDVRLDIRKRLDKDVYIFPQCAAAGDQSPHYIFRSRAEKIMAKRRDLSSRQEIARRIADAVEDVLPLAAGSIETRPVFKHRIVRINLSTHEPSTPPFYVTDTVEPVEIHVVRLGDIAVATNPFELFLDYGIRIKSQSPAVLTFIVQIACQNGGYLPTAKAIKGGGYSADKFIVGPQGGQQLVNVTLKHINELWN